MAVTDGNKGKGAGLHEMYLQLVRSLHSAQEVRWKRVFISVNISTWLLLGIHLCSLN